MSNTLSRIEKGFFSFGIESTLYFFKIIQKNILDGEAFVYLQKRKKYIPLASDYVVVSIGKGRIGKGFGCKETKRPILRGNVSNEIKWKKCSGHITVLVCKEKTLFRGVVNIEGVFYNVFQNGVENIMERIKLEQGRSVLKYPVSKKKTKNTSFLDRMVASFVRKQEQKPRALYLGVVTDCSYLKGKGKERKEIEIRNSIGLVNEIFKRELGIEVVIGLLEISEECEKEENNKKTLRAWNVSCCDKMSMEERLSLFSRWRGKQKTDMGIYHLMTGCIQNECYGIGWMGTVCQTDTETTATNIFGFGKKEYSSGTSVSVYSSNQYRIIAHEIAHNFGARHDCTDVECSSKNTADCCQCEECDCRGKYLMHPTVNKGEEFSPCTSREIKRMLPIVATCLKKRGTFETSVCGNGIKEGDEECDCGNEEECSKSLCCSFGCKLKEGAVCSDENESCCQNCRPIPKEKHVLCRPKNGLCQSDSFCDGSSGACPFNQELANGQKCEYTEQDGSVCVGGICTNRDRQCEDVFGLKKFGGSCSSPISCKMQCNDQGECVSLDVGYMDGTPCYFNGVCEKGRCTHTFRETIRSPWVIFSLVIATLMTVFLFVFLVPKRHRRYFRRLRRRHLSG